MNLFLASIAPIFVGAHLALLSGLPRFLVVDSILRRGVYKDDYPLPKSFPHMTVSVLSFEVSLLLPLLYTSCRLFLGGGGVFARRSRRMRRFGNQSLFRHFSVSWHRSD